MAEGSLLRRYGERIAARDGGWKCYYCNVPLRDEAVKANMGGTIPPDDPTIDHRTPIKRGGTDDIDNLVLSCRKCNNEKRTLTELEYVGHQHIDDLGDLRKYRIELPNMADDDMDAYQFRLYGHYKRVCGAAGGTCYESVRTTAEKTKMSIGMVVKTRDWLVENGWIAAKKRGQQTLLVTIVDRWPENMMRYSASVHVVNIDRSQGEPKNTTTTSGGGSEKPITTIWEEETRQPITPLMADDLHDLVEDFTYEWVVDAIKEAVQTLGPGRFGIKYVTSILARWRREGRAADKPVLDPAAPPPQYKRVLT